MDERSFPAFSCVHKRLFFRLFWRRMFSTFYEGRVFSRRVDRKWYFSRLFGRALVSRPFRDVTRLFFLPFNLQVKQEENEAALLLLSKRLKELDALPWEQRQIALIEGIIAGNVFDWGAKEVSK